MTVSVYAPQSSPRLSYVLDWIFRERLQVDYTLTQNPAQQGIHVAYGALVADAICIPDTCLLWETGVHKQEIATGQWNDLPVLFAAGGEQTIGFDLFAAVFYLLSRYEEYLPYTPDKHRRYPAVESVLYTTGLLERPLADEWVQALEQALQLGFALSFPPKKFSYRPSYDIDIAWSYRHKGFKRTVGAGFKDLLTGNTAMLRERVKVLSGSVKDPYDAFDDLQRWHKVYRLEPIYFILAAAQTSAFDKNISPANKAMQALIRQLAAEGEMGIHPSYNSQTKLHVLAAEKQLLEQIIGRKVDISRQHYLRMNLPASYHNLLQQGITADYTMGYGTHLGFRAGTGSAFYWYDLEQEVATALRVHPFCFMDSTARYDLELPADKAFERLESMKLLLQRCRSSLITVFHNFSLGTDREWPGWKAAYAAFLSTIS